jgi:hypothetical protein
MGSEKAAVFENKPPGTGEAREAVSEQTQRSRRTPTHALGGAEMQNFIGAELKALYNSILNEPISDSLLALLDELDKKKSQKP